MEGKNPFEGGNPFDALVRRRVPDPSSTGSPRLDNVLKRMEAARLQAEKQRELAHAALAPTAPVIPAPVQPEPASSTRKTTKHTPHQIWIMLCLVLWAVLTVTALVGNVIGGLILALPFFWACMILANLPQLFNWGPGRRNSNGRAV